jgi:competence protein ComEC
VGETGEQGMLEMYRGTDVLHCDVLKVGHHGSRYSSTEEFIDAVSPSIAVIGVGKKNPNSGIEYDFVSKVGKDKIGCLLKH